MKKFQLIIEKLNSPTFFMIVDMLGMCVITYWRPTIIENYLLNVENQSYDTQIKSYYKKLQANQPIVIEDINDKSIKEIGSWPPDRNTFSKLMTNLHKFGAKTVALYVLFSEKSINPVDLILNSEFIAYYT
jgi:adenylate cyclase